MRLPTLLMRILDPAEVYFDQVAGPRPRSVRRLSSPVQILSARDEDGAPYGTGPAELAAPPDGHRSGSSLDRAVVREEYAEELQQAARGLVDSGHARVQAPGAALDARLVTFWRGDAVLEVRRSSATSGGMSRSRIERGRLRDDEMFADHLAARLAQALAADG